MKSLPSLLLLALPFLVTLGTSPLSAEEPKNPYEIRNVKRVVKNVIEINDGWRSNFPAIEMDIRVTEKVTEKPYARIYYFDKDKKLIVNHKQVARFSDDGANYYSMPAVYAPKKWSSVCFGISDRADGWHRAVVVFGGKTSATAEVYPAGNISDYEFNEKALVLKSAPAPK
jgi:hypothetical protein